jgi:predicted CxxxxCH...CXXCH cytochrome family protein
VDQTTPDYPAEVVFLPLYTAKTGGATSYNEAAQTCDNISCHGGQTSPDWTAGMITVASDCTSCHQLASVSDQYNSYSSGRHFSHAEFNGWAFLLGYDPTCSACHDAAELPASGHFDNLDTAVVEGDPVATLLASLNYDNTTNPANPTCTNATAGCHEGQTRGWGGAAAPHPTDGTYRPGMVHGSDAKLNQANCQACHATPTSGGTNPKFTVDIIQNKGDERDPAATGCMKCHNTDTAHPSSQLSGATEDVHWYDSVDSSFITHNNAAGNNATTISLTCGLCHPGVGGTGTVGFDCLFCHVTDPAGDAVGTCTSCHSEPPSGNAAPNRTGRHDKGGHKEQCSVCHTNDGPDGTIDAVKHFTFPDPDFGQADLRSAPNTTPSNMTFTQTPGDVTCFDNCHGKDHESSGRSWY